MRDCLNNRRGFDRVLMTVAATFLTVSAGSALAQDQARSSAAELAIEAAIPRPEPANVPPPTAADIKLDTTATVHDSAKEPEAAKEPSPPRQTLRLHRPLPPLRPSRRRTSPSSLHPSR
jgi:hypothetical protein